MFPECVHLCARMVTWVPHSHISALEMASNPIVSQSVSIPGPAGNIEALLDAPPTAPSNAVGVICHPHPLHGGTMTNKVVHTLAKAFNDVGAPTLRFNYRGVGASAGTYDDGNGETHDALAVLEWAAQRWPGAQLWLGGFSFGGPVAVRASVAPSMASRITRLVTVAPAIRRVSVDSSALPRCRWLIVQGDRDELVEPADIQQWAQALPVKPRLVMLSGVEHFFHGRLNELRTVVVDWLSAPTE